MGRHSAAPVAVAAAPYPTGPITDPHLFDRPLAPSTVAAAPIASSFVAPPAAPIASSFVAPPAATTPPTAAIRSAWDFEEAVVDDETAVLPYTPVSVRGATPRGTDRIMPAVSGASLLGRGTPQQRYLRTGPIPIIAPSEPPQRAPIAFTRKREAALAAAALAVVGAMSGAAALLPSHSSAAEAATRLSSPMPTAAGTSANGVFCLSPLQLKRAMRHHHLKTRPTAQPAAVIADPATPEASSSPSASASASASPSASASASPTSSPSSSSSGSSGSSSSTAPLLDLPGLVGALPVIPSSLRSGTYALRDFATQSSGAVIAGGKLHGEGVGKTVVAMTENSSTKAGSVPGNGNNQGGLANPVNPLYLLRGVSDLQDVTVQGTEQGHLYNGLYMTGSNLLIKHVQINDIPGNSNANPGETFAIGANRVSGTATVDDLTINGGSGALSSAAGLAINNSDANWNISDLTTTNLKYSAGIALWQTRGTMNIRNYVQKGGARALGAERMAGTVNLYDPKWSAGTTGHDVTYTWDGGYSGGSINFYYSSAADVPDRKINIITNKASGISGSVHVYIGGVQQTTSNYVTVN